MENTEQHQVVIEGRKKVTATQIDSVERFSPTQIVLNYAGGKIVIEGSGMKITSFSRSGGSFTASGNINAVKYAQKGTGIKQRLFR